MPKIERIKLSDNQNLVASLADNEKLDLRIFVKTDSYAGAIKRAWEHALRRNEIDMPYTQDMANRYILWMLIKGA